MMSTKIPQKVVIFPDSYSQINHLTFLLSNDVEFSSFSTIDRQNEQTKILWTHIRNISEKELKSFANLQYIVSPTTSCTHLPVTFIEQNGITLLSLSDEQEFMKTIRATPDFTFSICLSLWHNLHLRSAKRTDFDRPQLQNAAIGIVGFGRVGSQVANYFHAMGCSVYFFDINQKSSNIASFRELSWLVSNSDILILSASTTVRRDVILNREILETCKEGQILVNTSRGHLLDESAVIDLLISNKLRSAWLDVLKEEELPQNDQHESLLALESVKRLISQGKLVVSPHAAGMCSQDLRACEIHLGNKLKEKISRI
jgi:D-3-phosphoglycerate dehydrogenase